MLLVSFYITNNNNIENLIILYTNHRTKFHVLTNYTPPFFLAQPACLRLSCIHVYCLIQYFCGFVGQQVC